MGLAEVIVGVFALIVAATALWLQRAEIARNSRITALVHMSSLLNQRIEFHAKIIDDHKVSGKSWRGHADRINRDLRPLKEKVDGSLIDIVAGYQGMPDVDVIKQVVIGDKGAGEPAPDQSTI